MSGRSNDHETIRAAAAARTALLRAESLGVSQSAMARMEREGVIERVAPGIYLGADRARHPLAEAAAWSLRYPHAVVCLLTAARYHHLTDAFPRGNWLYVPKGTTVPRSRHSTLHVVQTAPRFIDPSRDGENGVVTVDVHDVDLRITGPDRTTIDLWRYPRRIPSEHSLVALRRRVGAPDFELPRFARLAKRLDAWTRIEPVVQGMMVR